ncbi:MAG TPA: hypothetical protein VHZ75_01035 [Solirubrobacteraceae bacterium]|nr:hypothetical protein [Solirubrobacteraceae bacterium]
MIVHDVGGLSADLATIEALARLRLAAHRLGCGLLLRGASRELALLVVFCGLADVLPCEPSALGRTVGQLEEREHPRRVEERVERGDLPP